MSIILHNSPWDCEFQPIHEIRSPRKIELLYMAVLAMVYMKSILKKEDYIKSYLLLSPNIFGIDSVNDGVILVKNRL